MADRVDLFHFNSLLHDEFRARPIPAAAARGADAHSSCQAGSVRPRSGVSLATQPASDL